MRSGTTSPHFATLAAGAVPKTDRLPSPGHARPRLAGPHGASRTRRAVGPDRPSALLCVIALELSAGQGPTVERMAPDAADVLLTVGLMSRRSGLTAKALRHHDQVGLPRPAAMDAAASYRRYHPAQAAKTRLVQLLRSLDLPIEQVRIGVVAWKGDDTATIERLLTAHRRRIDARITRLHGARTASTTSSRKDFPDPCPPANWLPNPEPPPPPRPPRRAHRAQEPSPTSVLAARLFNEAWRQMKQENRTALDDDRMIHTAHASRYH